MVAGDPPKFEAPASGAACRRAAFVLSAQRVSQLPDDSRCEVAFAGRSNAGKSSVINTLCANARLARTSRTPGRTQAINCFRVGEGHYLVDLPGYGYAKVSQAQRRHWGQELGRYFTTRAPLHGLLLVLDIRRLLTDLDWQMIHLAAEGGARLHCLLNKADKLSASAARRSLETVRASLTEAGVAAGVQCFSATRKAGVEDCYRVLDGWFAETP